MKVENYTRRPIHLCLSEREASWLRAYMQNHHGQGEESPEDHDMRKMFFECLDHHIFRQNITNRKAVRNETSVRG